MPVSDDRSSGMGSGWARGRARHTAGRCLLNETWTHALFSLRLKPGEWTLGVRRSAVWVAARASRALFDSTVDLHSTQSISIHHSQSSQSISIYDREIGERKSVFRFLYFSISKLGRYSAQHARITHTLTHLRRLYASHTGHAELSFTRVRTRCVLMALSLLYDLRTHVHSKLGPNKCCVNKGGRHLSSSDEFSHHQGRWTQTSSPTK